MKDKTRKFFIRSYLTEEQLQNILEKNRSIIYRWAYALHDKDTEGDKPKVAHTHIYLEFTNTYKISKPRNMFKGLIDDKGKEINTHIEFVDKTTAHCIQYLIHKGYADKFQYSPNIIKSNNLDLDYLLSVDLSKASKREDNSFNILESLLENGYNSAQLIELSKLYGKDFIYHYRTFKELYFDIKHCQHAERKFIDDNYIVDNNGEIVANTITDQKEIKKLEEIM